MPGSTSPRHAYTPDSDLQFVEACAPELEAYLLASVIYWPLAQPKGRSPLPRLTLGGLLLALHRLGAVERDLPAAQAVRLTRARTRIETERLRWAAAIGAKMTLETHARLSLWRAYLDDLKNPNYGDEAVTGTLHVFGAIAQKYRGLVVISGGTITAGYAKNYGYDQRLKYDSPPHFLDPVASAWQVVTWAEQKPAFPASAP